MLASVGAREEESCPAVSPPPAAEGFASSAPSSYKAEVSACLKTSFGSKGETLSQIIERGLSFGVLASRRRPVPLRGLRLLPAP